MGVAIPPPLLMVIEDVGWWKGSGNAKEGEPFRTGMGRDHFPEDYEALVRLAKKLGTQVVTGLVLCEWDRKGFLTQIPSTTWLGKEWKGCREGGERQQKAVSILNENRAYICPALHGVGHEYWIDGEPDRSEFHNAHGLMRDREEVLKHLWAFFRIYESMGLSLEPPRIFIPPALKHSFGNGEDGFQKMIAEFGIHFVLTVFGKARKFTPPHFPAVTEECGVVLVERGIAPVSWNHISASPVFDFDQPVLPLHWANILHRDPLRNGEVVDRWVAHLKKGVEKNEFVLLDDALSSLRQIIIFSVSDIYRGSDGIVIDIHNAQKILPGMLQERGFYASLPPDKTIDAQDGRIEPADHIMKNLVRIFPWKGIDAIRITKRKCGFIPAVNSSFAIPPLLF